MSWSWCSRAVVAVVAVTAVGTGARAVRCEAQQVREVGAQLLVTTQDPLLATGGLYGGLRVSRRTRLALTAGAGGAGGDFTVRAEALGHFLLNPAARGKPGVYAGAGVAFVAGPEGQGYVVLLVGVEGSPGGRSGWALEAGLGGGFRATAGYRWRSFPLK